MTGIYMLFRMVPLDMVVRMKRRKHQTCTKEYKQKRAKYGINFRTLHVLVLIARKTNAQINSSQLPFRKSFYKIYF